MMTFTIEYLHTIRLGTLHHEEFEKMQICITTLFVCLAVEAQAELAKESGWGPVLVLVGHRPSPQC